MRPSLSFLASALFTLLLFSACSPSNGAREPEDPPRLLEEARALWDASAGGSYTYRLERSCFCAPRQLSARVTVRDGAVVSIDDLRAEGEPVDDASQYNTEAFVSVEALFDLVQRFETGDIDNVNVTYDDALGYPTDLYVDYNEGMADEEISYRASDVSR